MVVSSFLIYFFSFFISVCACYWYEKIDDSYANKKENKQRLYFLRLRLFKADILKFLCAIFVLIPPIFLTVFRGLDVGTDNHMYLIMYDKYKVYDVFEYLDIYYPAGIFPAEVGYHELQRISYIIDGGYNFLKFLCGFLIIFFVWRGIVYYHKKFGINSGLCLSLYYLSLFSFSLNIVRFSIALAIFFYSFQFVLEKKLFRYLAWCVVMWSFHVSLVVAPVFYLLNFSMSANSKKFWKYFALILVVLVGLLSRVVVSTFIPYLSNVVNRLSTYVIAVPSSTGIGVYLICALILLPLLRWDSFLIKHNSWSAVLLMCTMYVPIRFLAYYEQTLVRLSYIPLIITIVLYSGLSRLPISIGEAHFWKFYTILVFIGYYIMATIVEGSMCVYPYIFDLTNHY